MKLIRCLLFVALVSAPALPSSGAEGDSARLSPPEAVKLYRQIVELMEATSVAVPELSRAAAPLIENVRQAEKTLQVGNTREHTGILYRFLTNARIYLQISDAVPKPEPFAEETFRQMGTLRAHIDRADAHFRALLAYREEQALGRDRDNLQRYAEENRRLGPPGESESRVVFLGDSITDGWKLNQYFPGKPYLNRGISGQISGQMLGRMKADVIDLEPAAVVVLAGTNDLARGVPLEVIKDNLTMIAELAAASGIKPILASILPVNDHHKDKDPNYERTIYRPPQQIWELNTWLQGLCKAHGFIYLDYYSALAGSEGQLQAALADDGLHPNGEGYKLMAPLAQAAIDQALRQAPAPERKRRFGIF